jgi:hypothetical protein
LDILLTNGVISLIVLYDLNKSKPLLKFIESAVSVLVNINYASLKLKSGFNASEALKLSS